MACGKKWLFIAVYASPRAYDRKQLWLALDELQRDMPCFLLGDFKSVLRGEKRSMEKGVLESFANWVMHHGLIDLGFVGHKYTWSHGGSVENRRATRLD